MTPRCKVCDDCTRNCLLLHSKRQNRRPIVTRFFKIMFGVDISKILFLPPKVARTVRDLDGKETQLEDVNGKKWCVRLSYVNGSLAFKDGWPEFFSDHTLQLGDLLVFEYIKGSHFVVQTYDTSACEILEFENRRKARQNKKSRKNLEMVVEDELVRSVDMDFMNQDTSSTIVAHGSGSLSSGSDPTAENGLNFDFNFGQPGYMEEDPVFLLDRNGVCYQEDRNFLYDLSNFEMEKTVSDVYNEKPLESSPPLSNVMDQAEAKDDVEPKNVDPTPDMAKDDVEPINVDPTPDMAKDEVDPNNVNTTPDINADICMGEFHGKFSTNESILGYDMRNDVSKFINNERSCTVPGGNDSVLQLDSESPSTICDIDVQEPAVKSSDFSVSDSLQKDQTGSQNQVGKPFPAFKKEMVVGLPTPGLPQVSYGKLPTGEMNSILSCSPAPIVKIEPGSSHDTSFSTVVENLLYLMTPLPVSVCGRVRVTDPVRIVYLKDSCGRVWPLLSPPSYWFRALYAGWTKFCEANLVKCGDICEFQLESSHPRMYRVSIIHKSG